MPQDVDLSSCVQCGSPLPPRARFCPECGTPTGAIATGIAAPFKSSLSAPPAERRPVAIMFADLCGYTELSSTLDPEEMHRVLGRYFELIDAVVVRFGGSIDKHVGDAVMAVFGAPVAHGNDVERAVRAACEVHNAMRTLAAELGRPLAAHVGIASGEVVAAATGSAAHREYTMTGDAVNLAARLEELAGAGQTMVSDEVYRALANRLDAVSSGAVLVRGLRDPVPVWAVRAIRVSRAAGVPLIGREAEVQRFSSIIGRVNEQRVGATALLRADPGLGKTRLAEEFLSLAESMGFACHTAVVLDFGTGRGRDAVTALVCSLLGVALDSDDAARHLALERALERRLVDADQKPFAAELLGLSQHADTLYEAMDNTERVQGKLRTLCGLIERSSARKPRLLMVEDVHWATPWILDCLAETAAVAERSLAVLLLTSRRDGDPVAAGWPLGNIERFDLEPLSASDALALAQAFAPTGQDHVKRCIERAQGNPLFLTQLLQADPEGDAVPATIQSVVLARLDRLPLPDKRALQAASVIGQRFSLDLLRYMLRDDAYNPTTALASELIRVDGARAEQNELRARVDSGRSIRIALA